MADTNHAIRIHSHGGAEVLRYEALDVAAPGPGEARVRHEAIGLNFIDTYHRSGLYPLPLPSGLGSEAAGVVEAVGAGVTEVAVGDRVAYAGGPLGAYAQIRCLPASVLVRLPDAISCEQGAAMMLQGMTAHYLLFDTWPVKAGDAILVHAAAGGVGSIMVQWARALGAEVIGTVGSAAKAERARALGCAHVINYSEEDFAARVREITGGTGVPVVYDSIGRNTFDASLACLRPRGTMVTYGNATGPVAPFECARLAALGSLYVTRPKLADYIATRAELELRAQALFEVVANGSVRIDIGQRFKLEEAAEAHRVLESRATVGSTVLLP